MSCDINEKIVYKMILLGENGVGKSSIFKKIISGAFNEKSISTIGMDRRTISINIKTSEGEKEIDVQLWDTAGQERFRSITSSYYKSSQGLLIMYDITNKDTFNTIGDWINDITSSLGENNNYLMVLIGNKVDLVNFNPDLREVTLEQAQNLCKEKNLYWGGECSVKYFEEEQLREIFTTFTEEIYKKVGNDITKGSNIKNDIKPKKFRC